MELKKLLNTWQGTQQENRWMRALLFMLVGCNLLLVITLVGKETPVVLVPPNITDQVKISKNTADAETKKAWGLYVAQLIGNVTPGNADFVAEVIEPLLHPRIYKSVRENLAYQIESLKLERVSLSFTPRSVSYEPASDRVFVSGQLISAGMGDAEERSNRTYELQISIDRFRPMITFLDVYKGGVRTLAKKEQIRKNQERIERMEARQ